jgi:hypothetical protein
MTSLLTNLKQVPANAGFYITVADCRTTFYTATGTDAAPLFSTNIYARSTVTSTLLATGGTAVLRDHGKALVSSGRVFRKVQLMVSSGQVTNGGSDGVGGIDLGPGVTPGYITGYIELPGLGVGSGVAGVAGATIAFTPVARLG